MQRIITKEVRVTDGHHVTMGYDKINGQRRWWATDVDESQPVRRQQVSYSKSRREARRLFGMLYEAWSAAWFDEHESMFRYISPLDVDGPFGANRRAYATFFGHR